MMKEGTHELVVDVVLEDNRERQDKDDGNDFFVQEKLKDGTISTSSSTVSLSEVSTPSNNSWSCSSSSSTASSENESHNSEILETIHGNDNITFTSRSFIRIDGDWYDITKFIPHHPGGAAIIEEFIGRDATEVFLAFHYQPYKVLKRVKKLDNSEAENCNTFINNARDQEQEAFSQDFRCLIQELRDDGYFEPDYFFLTQKIAFVFFCFWMAVYYLLKGTQEAREKQDEAFIQSADLLKSVVAMSLFLQQSGFLMHDFMHNTWFYNRKIDQAFGRFFGCVCLGVSGIWWRDEHFVHHTFTNTFDDTKKKVLDVQMLQKAWAHHEHLLQFFNGSIPTSKYKRQLFFLPLKWSEFVIRNQACMFVPLTVILGRIMIIQKALRQTVSSVDRILQGIHVFWFLGLLGYAFFSRGYFWKAAWKYNMLINVGQGVLHIQLLMNHYMTPWYDIEEVKTSCWYLKQIMTTVNMAPLFSTCWLRQQQPCGFGYLPFSISSLSLFWDYWDECVAPWLDDWFHGGLNLHIEHHTVPMLPRSSLRECRRRIRRLCQKHGIHYDERHPLQALWDILVELNRVGSLAQFGVVVKEEEEADKKKQL